MKFLSTLLSSAAASLVIAGAANAADIYTAPPVAATPDVFAAPAPLWTGGYAGGFVGYGWGDVDFTDTGLAQFCDPDGDDEVIDDCPRTFGTDVDGWLGGLFVGYNWQAANNFVFGVEADMAFADIDGFGEEFELGYDGGEPDDPADAVSAQINAIGTLRGRIGYAFDNFLIFGTGGLAVAHLDHIAGDRQTEGGAISFEGSENVALEGWEWGWTIGGGAEFALNDRWSVRGDYLYVDLGEEEGDIFDINDDGPESGEFDTTFHTVRLGIAAHF